VDITTIETEYREEWKKLIVEYGDPLKVPRELTFVIGEILRAKHILIAHPEANPAQVLRQHSIPASVISKVANGMEEPRSRQKRVDKYRKLMEWAETHVLEQISVGELADIGEVSYPTALKFINDRVDLFRKIKRGVYEVRDAKSERLSGR